MRRSRRAHNEAVESTAAALARVNAFGRAVKADLPAVEVALAELRTLLARAEVSYALVGGVAVIHHGYVRTTRDIDLLLDRGGVSRVVPLLHAAGFDATSERRWRHRSTGVQIDLLFAGEPMPRERDRYPHPDHVGRSPRESDIVDLPALIALKLQAGRFRDEADVVELLQHLDEGEYLAVEAALAAELRPRLFELRTVAIEERRWDDRHGGR